MFSDSSESRLVALIGPTASGKTDLSLVAAAAAGGEIVNCDSVQVYRGMDIGTAKLPLERRRGIPHHLIDICDPAEVFSAGDYAARARQAVRDISGRGALPIVTGGTGFYLRALLQGLFEGPPRDPALRERLASREPDRLHRMLTRLDPPSAARIHNNDRNKTIRALEVYFSTRVPMTELHRKPPQALEGFRATLILLDPPRAELYARINQRCAEMFQTGLVEEVQNLLKAGVPESAHAMRAVGYREAIAVLRGDMTLEDAVTATQQATRNYAKRQLTWFRKEPGVITLHGFGNDPEIQQEVIDLVQSFRAPATN